MELKEIIKYLNEKRETETIADWTIHKVKVSNKNLYVTRDFSIEDELFSVRENFHITLFKYFEDKIGESSFKINLNSTMSDLEDKFKFAVLLLKESLSPKYVLPKRDDFEVKDNEIDYSIFYNRNFVDSFEKYDFNSYLNEKLTILKELLNNENANTSSKELIIYLNYLELFNSMREITLVTSTGIKKSYTKSSHYLELALSSKSLKSDIDREHIVYEKINDLFDFNFKKYFEKQIKYSKDALEAREIKSYNLPVIITDAATPEFFFSDVRFSPLISFSFGRIKYLKISNYEIGKKVVKSEFDPINISSDPLISHNIASVPFDELGVTAKKVDLIKDSVCQNFIVSKKYATYLNIKPSGPFGTIVVGSGSKSIEELRSLNDKYIEIVSFSWFDPNFITGDFSSEIRLGYIVENSQKKPFRGGLFVGNIFEILKKVYFSKERITIPHYVGPNSLYFQDGKIVGLD